MPPRWKIRRGFYILWNLNHLGWSERYKVQMTKLLKNFSVFTFRVWWSLSFLLYNQPNDFDFSPTWCYSTRWWLLQCWWWRHIHTYSIFTGSYLSFLILQHNVTWQCFSVCHSVICNHTSLVSEASRCKFYIRLLSNGLTSFLMKCYTHTCQSIALCSYYEL